MVAIMLGSNSFQIFRKTKPVNAVVGVVYATSAVALAAVGAVGDAAHFPTLCCYLLFEFNVGVYFPAIATQRARYIPNEVRATVMSLYRVPLNLLVVVALTNVAALSTAQIALYSFGLVVAAAVAQRAIAAGETSDGDAGGTKAAA